MIGNDDAGSLLDQAVVFVSQKWDVFVFFPDKIIKVQDEFSLSDEKQIHCCRHEGNQFIFQQQFGGKMQSLEQAFCQSKKKEYLLLLFPE